MYNFEKYIREIWALGSFAIVEVIGYFAGITRCECHFQAFINISPASHVFTFLIRKILFFLLNSSK